MRLCIEVFSCKSDTRLTKEKMLEIHEVQKKGYLKMDKKNGDANYIFCHLRIQGGVRFSSGREGPSPAIRLDAERETICSSSYATPCSQLHFTRVHGGNNKKIIMIGRVDCQCRAAE